MLVSAAVNGYALVMTFNKALDPFSILQSSAFTVKRTRGGTELTVPVVGKQRISFKSVTLTLSSPLLSTDTSVKVSYTKPTTDGNNKIRGVDSRETEDFSDQAVTNNTTTTVPGQPRNFTVIYGDTKAFLSWEAPTTAATNITHYEYRHAAGTSVPAATTWQSTTSGLVTEARITGLINGTEYALDLRAVSAYGNSLKVNTLVTPQANRPATGTVEIVGPIRLPGKVHWDPTFPSDSDGQIQANQGTLGETGGYEFQWLRVDGATETVITGATSSEYTLTQADVGKKLKFRLSFVDDRGNAESLTSAAFPASGTILTTAACPAPAYTGGASQLWTSNIAFDFGNEFTKYGFYADYGALDDITITTDYTIKRFQQYKSGATNEIRLELSRQIATGEEDQLTLYVCDTPLRFADATYSSTGHRYTWDNASNRVNLFEHGVRTLYVSRDQTAPAVASAYVAGTALTITFTEDLGDAASLENSAFTVKKTTLGGTEATVVTLSTTVGPVISGKTVTLTLATALVSTDGSVKVTYTKPTTGTANKLVDAAANETGTFTDQTVINNTATITSAATGAPVITPANAFRVPGVLTANKGSIADADGLPLESTFTWQWVQVDGMTETDIVSATSQTYTLTAADVGKKIKVKASFTDTGTPPTTRAP